MNAQTKVKPPTGLDLLRQPFADHQISKLPKETRKQIEERKNDRNKMLWNCPVCGGHHHKDAIHLDYVGHAALTDRLLECDPGWSWEPFATDQGGLPSFDRNGGLWINLTVCGVTRSGYGDADGKTGGNAVKEAIGDALRNAAMRFGAALDLWHKGDLHLDEPQEGQSQGDDQGAVSPPASAKGWREPDSTLSTPSKLAAEMRRLERELMGCGDSDMVYALTMSDEWKEFSKIARKHAPHYLTGGDPAPEEFEGLQVTAERLVREFDTATANDRVGMVSAG